MLVDWKINLSCRYIHYQRSSSSCSINKIDACPAEPRRVCGTPSCSRSLKVEAATRTQVQILLSSCFFLFPTCRISQPNELLLCSIALLLLFLLALVLVGSPAHRTVKISCSCCAADVIKTYVVNRLLQIACQIPSTGTSRSRLKLELCIPYLAHLATPSQHRTCQGVPS